MAKRGHGEGTITKRKDGRWMAQITVSYDPKTGRTRRVTFYGKKREEVLAKLDQARRQHVEGVFIEPHKVTLGDWLDRWLNDYMKPHLRQKTWEDYESIVRVHIKPTLGDVPLKKLQPAEVQALYTAKLESGLSARRVRLIHVILHAALKQATKEDLLFRNVTEATKPPKAAKREFRTLSVKEVRTFLAAAKDDPLYPAFLLMVATGMRRGELLGLRWQDVDFKSRTIKIKQSVVQTGTGAKIEPPKTDSGRRMIPLPEGVAQELRRHKARQSKIKLALGAAYEDHDLVFAGPLGKPRDPKGFWEAFKRLLKKAGLPDVRLHDLRHTFASLLLERGENPKVVQELLGHSSIAITMDIYSHTMPGLKEKAIAKLNDIFTPLAKTLG